MKIASETSDTSRMSPATLRRVAILIQDFSISHIEKSLEITYNGAAKNDPIYISAPGVKLEFPRVDTVPMPVSIQRTDVVMNAKLPSVLQYFVVPLRPKLFSVRSNRKALSNQARMEFQIEQRIGCRL
jgi:hypothetical protein